MGIEILLSALALATSDPTRSSEVVGYSSQGRAIRVHRLGDPASPNKVLVVGCIHGNEDAGVAITRKLIRKTPPATFDLWVVNVVNPDGRRLGVRQNVVVRRYCGAGMRPRSPSRGRNWRSATRKATR